MIASKCTNATTPLVSIATDGNALNSSDLGRKSSSELSAATPSSCGETSSTTAGKTESTAPLSATRARISARGSYDRRIRLLMSSGLIAGITPTSMRQRSPQKTLDFAFSQLGGDGAGARREDL